MENHQSILTEELAKALYTVNRHAKTAPEPQHLYYIKKEAIGKLLHEKRARKVGLHFSDHPKLSNQHSTLLIKVGSYYFHVPPHKDDFKQLRHLGELDRSYRNPQARMSLSKAKKTIYQYINYQPAKKRPNTSKKNHTSAYFTASSLGKMNWPGRKSSTRNFK